MILLQINNQTDISYHIFGDREQVEYFLTDNYTNVTYYQKDEMYFFDFDGLRMFGRVILPINHMEYEKAR